MCCCPKDWIKKKDELVKVFNWRTGTKSHTTGIDITNKPFMLENDKGEEIAVFLMDTQGSFDKKMSAGECSLIFALSILISSVQVYNLPSGIIRESDLQQLGLFLQHANTTVKNKSSNPSESSSLFPPLMFLVRNWQMLDYNYGSKGGMEYLEEVMEADQDENKDVRKKIKEGFPDVRCHLLRDPGEKVKESSDSSQLKLTDIDERFLVGVDDLAKCLFSKDSLVVKQLDGKACTGKDIMQLAGELDNMIKSGQTPQVHTLMKLNQIVEFYKKIDEFENEYVATMNSKGEKYIDPKILKTFHDECFQKAMQQYEEHDVFEPDESNKQCQKLKTRLNGCYAIIQQDNEARKVREQNIIMDKVGVAGNVYFEEMEKVADGQHLEDAITAKAEAERKANEAFKTSTSDCNQDLVKKCENKLHEAIQLKHREFERINANRLEICVELKRTINEYLAQFEKVENKYVEDEYLHQIHESSKQQALQTYANNENSVSPEARESFSENMDKLKNEMEQIFIFKTDMNKNNKEKVERIIQLFYAEVSVEYLETMKEVAKYGEPMLIKVHEIYKKYISEKVKQEIPISTLRESTKEECNRMLDELREKVEAHWTTWLIYVAVGATVLLAAGSLLACIGFAAAGVVATQGAATTAVAAAEGTAVATFVSGAAATFEGTAFGGVINTIFGGVTFAANTSATIMLIIERFFSWMMNKNIKDSPCFTTLQEVRPFFIN